MKKIYYLMYLLPLMPLVSACEDDAEVVRLQNQSAPAVSVEGISPEYGYAGDRFTITGANFGSGVDFVRVFIGENEAEVLTCTDTQIQAVVPDDATSGWVSVQYMGQEVKSDLMYRVMGKPEVVAMSPLFGDGSDAVAWGFAGGELTFGGGELGGSESDIDVRFTGSAASAQVTSWSANAFTVQVPEDAQSGAVTLNVGSQREVNVPYAFRLVQHAEVAKVTPATGYKGSLITLSGTELADATVVMFGGSRANIERVVRVGDAVPGGTATEDSLIVTAPSDLTEGTEYAISIRTPFETVEEAAMFTVSPDATNFQAGTDGENALGYVGNRVTIKGEHMPADTETMQVLFGDKEAEIESYENGVLTVIIPADAATGQNQTLTLVYAGREFTVSSAFEVKEGPVVESSDAAVFVGGTMTITGQYLNAEDLDLTVMLGDTEITPTTNDGSTLSFTIPDGTSYTKDATVVLNYGDAIDPIELKVDVIPNETDITQYVLAEGSYKSPFTADGNNVAGWTKNGNLGTDTYFSENASEVIRLISPAQDGAMYQTATLPAGDYKVSITVIGDDDANGRDGVVFAIMNGDVDFPGLTDQNPKGPWHFNSDENVLFSSSLNEGDNVTSISTHEFDNISLAESGVVRIGFATMLANHSSGQNYLDISEIKIERIAN